MAKKEHNTKPTIKQRNAVANMIENRGNASKAMRDAGYSHETAKNPSWLTESKGFAQIMNEAGLTEENLAKELYKDIVDKREIKAEKRNRVPELTLAAKMKGLLTDKSEVKQDQTMTIRWEGEEEEEVKE